MTTKFNSILLRDKNSYYILDDSKFINETAFLNNIAEVLNSGVDVLELKFQNLSSKEILSIVKKARELCSYFDALLVIFDRIDIAKLAEADGIVLNSNTISPNEAKKLVEDAMLIGFECFSIENTVELSDKNIDFIISNLPNLDCKKKYFVFT